MKSANASSVIVRFDRESRPCCIAQVHALLKRVRARHRLEQSKPCVEGRIGNQAETDYPAPSRHDFHVSELEASLLAECPESRKSNGTEYRYDDPVELARARLVFAITWLVPLLLVSATLAIFGATLGLALTSLLQFSMLAMAVPLTGSLAALLLRGFKLRRKHKP